MIVYFPRQARRRIWHRIRAGSRPAPPLTVSEFLEIGIHGIWPLWRLGVLVLWSHRKYVAQVEILCYRERADGLHSPPAERNQDLRTGAGR